MANITAAEVNKLRQQTGAGMMDCKKALVEAAADLEKAIDILRKKGQKIAAKREDRKAKEGLVIAKTSSEGKKGVLIVLNCETDFVAKNDEFIQFAESVVKLAIENNPPSIDNLKSLTLNGTSVEEGITELIGKIGEKIDLSQYEVIESAKVVAYNHPGNRLATLVGLNDESVDDQILLITVLQI